MICIKCKERIPYISNINFEKGTIILYCQCDKINEKYEISNYNTEIEKIKKENIVSIKNLTRENCFIHKKNYIEFFCLNCSKELCFDCDLKYHQKMKHQIIKLSEFLHLIENNLQYYKKIDELVYCPKIPNELIGEFIT